MSVLLMRLTTGELILAQTTIDGSTYNLKKPAWIAQVKAGEFALVPWIPLAKEEKVSLDARSILYCVEPEEGILNEYNQSFGSGLIVPNGIKPISLSLTGG